MFPASIPFSEQITMASKRLLVELYYDVISPFSYLCFEALCRYRRLWNMELALKPFFLGGIMRETGNMPPAMVINKKQKRLFINIS